jgi:hypothetical protein
MLYPHTGGLGCFRPSRDQSREVGCRGPLGTLDVVNNVQLLEQLHTIFYGVRLRGHPTYRVVVPILEGPYLSPG